MPLIKQKISNGLLWSAIDVAIRQGTQFVILIIMTRILSPQDFGLIALLALFVGLANVVVDEGFGSALIQRNNVTHLDESTVFFINLTIGFAVSIGLCVAAPFIAKYFENLLLRDLTYVMAFNILVGSLGAIHNTLLIKSLNFRLIAKISGFSSTLSGMLAVLLAINGFGVWSLAIQTLSSTVLSTVLFWIWHPWRPLWKFSIATLHSYFRYGSYLMVVAFVDVLNKNLYSVLIGKFYSLGEVGHYDRARKTYYFPLNFMMLTINRVAFSSFSSIAENKESLTRGLRKAQRLFMFVNLPISMSMITLAEPLVLILYGDKWVSVATILQVLGLAGLVWPMHLLNINVLKAQGRSDLFFRIMLIKKTVSVVLTIVASFHGIIAIAWAQVAASSLSLLVNTHYSKKLLDYGAIQQLLDLKFSILASIIMYGVISMVISAAPSNCYIQLGVGLGSGFTTYILLTQVFRVNGVQEIIELLGLRSKNSIMPRGSRKNIKLGL